MAVAVWVGIVIRKSDGSQEAWEFDRINSMLVTGLGSLTAFVRKGEQDLRITLEGHAYEWADMTKPATHREPVYARDVHMLPSAVHPANYVDGEVLDE